MIREDLLDPLSLQVTADEPPLSVDLDPDEPDGEWEHGVVARRRPPLIRRPLPRVGSGYLLPGAVLSFASFLLFMSLLLPVFLAPRVARIPLNTLDTVTAGGTGSYFSPARAGLVESDALQMTTTIRGDVDAGSDGVAVWDSFEALVDLRPEVPERDRVVSAREQRVALHRRTGEAVACCGESPAHQGLAYRFPFNTRQRTYSLWNSVIAEARPATFVRADRLNGLEVYVFTSRVEPTPLGTEVVPGDLANSSLPSVEVTVMYEADREVWVEPRSGRVVQEFWSVQQRLERQGAPSASYGQVQMSWTEETVARQVSQARRESSRLEGVSSALPITALVAGALLLGVGVILTILVLPARREG